MTCFILSAFMKAYSSEVERTAHNGFAASSILAKPKHL